MFNVRLTFSGAFKESPQIERIEGHSVPPHGMWKIDVCGMCSKKRIKKEPQGRLSGV
jgi:hypothetical protein